MCVGVLKVLCAWRAKPCDNFFFSLGSLGGREGFVTRIMFVDKVLISSLLRLFLFFNLLCQ